MYVSTYIVNIRFHNKAHRLFRPQNTLLCYTLLSVLVLGTGIAKGQYYWILSAFLGIVLTLPLFQTALGPKKLSSLLYIIMYENKMVKNNQSNIC